MSQSLPKVGVHTGLRTVSSELSPLMQLPESPVCSLGTTILPTPGHISQQGQRHGWVGGSGRGGTRSQKKASQFPKCHGGPVSPRLSLPGSWGWGHEGSPVPP